MPYSPEPVVPAPPCPPEAAAVWEAIEPQVRDDAQVRAGILWSLHGETLRAAAEKAGIGREKLNYWLRRVGVHGSTFAARQLVGTHRRVAQLAAEELERRMLSAPEQVSDMALNAICGTSTDKIAKAERWGEKGDGERPSYASALEKLATALAEGKVSLRIEVSPREGAEAVNPGPVIEAQAEPAAAIPHSFHVEHLTGIPDLCDGESKSGVQP